MNTLSEAYIDNPLLLHHIAPLDFAAVQQVPETHRWPHFDSGHDQPVHSVPTVDLSDPNVVEHVGRACETWGVFQLTNHGLPSGLLEEAEEEARRLFALPAGVKAKALRSPGGATGYGVARISPFFAKYMWHEGFTIIGSPKEHATKLWPHRYLRFCKTMEEYQREMKDLAERLVRLIYRSLNIPEQEIKDYMDPKSDTPCTALQLNSYPSCPDPNRAMGLAPHTDTFLLTILHQNDTNGLQIHHHGAGWVPVSPGPRTLVVNVGDMFHIISNGRFPSVRHRAVVNRTRQRLSMSFFYGPPMDSRVGPMRCGGDGACYRCVTVKEFISMKGKDPEKALLTLRCPKSYDS